MRTAEKTRQPDESRRGARSSPTPTCRLGEWESLGAGRHLLRALGNQALGAAIQAKLAIGPVDDPYEREADRLADAVMQMPDPTMTPEARQQVPGDRIQRMCPRCQRRHRQGMPLNCEECETKLQRKGASTEAPAVDGALEQHIKSLREGGRSLPGRIQSFFEPRLGSDFSDVRIHTDAAAHEAARSVNARAFTIGRNIMFGAGEYQPQTEPGRRLLAHELVHVIQQSGGPLWDDRDSSSERDVRSASESLRITPVTGKAFLLQRRNGGRQTRTAVVRVRWTFDEAEFYRRLVAVVAHSSGFRGVRRAALWGPMHGPATRFHRRHSRAHPRGLGENDGVRVRVSAGFDPRSHGGSIYNVGVESPSEPTAEPDRPPRPATLTPEQAATPAGQWAQTVTGFLRVSAGSHVFASFLVSRDEIRLLKTEARGDDPGDPGREAPTGRLALTLARFLEIARARHPQVYEVQIQYRAGIWRLTEWNRLAEIRPAPQRAAAQASGPGRPDEAERIIEDIRGTRQMVLSTAAELIAEQDPTRLENIVTAAGPFAVAKVARIGRLARLRRLGRARRLLRTMRLPRAVPFRGNAANLDPELVRLARDVRATQAGVSRQAFRRFNVATARVRVDGEVRYLDAGNLRNGLHSEEWLHTQVMQLRRSHREVHVEQLYSERIPCRRTCGPLLSREHPNAEIFFSTRGRGNTAARDLADQYGVTGR